MDSLKTLMDKHEFDLVIKLTASAKDCASLFYRISALLSKNRGIEALEVINQNQKELQKRLAFLIRVHIELLCLMERYDDAYEKLDYYKNLPYESQEVEEVLKEMPKYIREEEKHNYVATSLSDEQVEKLLNSKNQEQVIAALDAVRDRKIDKFFNSLCKLMVNYEKQSIRSFTLLVMVQNKVNQKLPFNHMGKIIEVNPSEIEPPFLDDKFKIIVDKIETEFKDPVLSENAIQIYSSYILYRYPEVIQESEEDIIFALKYVANQYLQKDNSSLEVSEKIKNLIVNIKVALEDF